MPRSTLSRREFYERIAEAVKRVLGDSVLGIILFGSYIYMGRGRDIDLVIVVREEVSARKRFDLELAVSRELRKIARDTVFDVHILSMEDFKRNLTPGTFLSGLALGYEILLDKADINNEILKFLQKLASEKYILHNRHGTWNLSHHARVLLKLKSKCGDSKS